MAYRNTMKNDIDNNLDKLEYEITGDMTLRELYAALVIRYCHPIRRFDQFNNLLGAGYYERYWKVKGIERATSKREGGLYTLAPTSEPYKEDELEGKKFIDLVDDFAIRNSKDCNTPCENIIRENILSRVNYFYMDILSGILCGIKNKDIDIKVAYKSDLIDFIEDIFDSEEIKEIEITDEIKGLIRQFIEVFDNGKSDFIKNFLLEETSVLLYDRHSLCMDDEEKAEGNIIIEKLRKSIVVLSDLIYVSDKTYTAFMELVYAGLYKLAEGDKTKMTDIVECEMDSVKELINVKENGKTIILGEKVFKNVSEISDTDINNYVKTILD